MEIKYCGETPVVSNKWYLIETLGSILIEVKLSEHAVRNELTSDHTRSKLFLKWPSIYETREILFLKFIALFSIINFMNRRISHKRD